MKHLKFILILIIPVFLFSCDELFNGEGELTEEEIVEGLKTALEIGTDSSCITLNKTNGYFGNKLLKILLPSEADPILDNLQYLDQDIPLFGNPKDLIDAKIDEVVLGINRSAEDAAVEAKPIFVNAITTMTVDDGIGILYGKSIDTTITQFDSLAATHYLEHKTRIGLTELFSPKIDASLDRDLGIGFSANEAWYGLLEIYNNTYVQTALDLAGVGGEVEEVSLGVHAVTKALDGLFYLVGDEERKIRKDPYQWAIDIIQKIFGYVFEE